MLTLSMTSIFVVHEALATDDNPNRDPHDYWKMRIVSMHKNPKTQERWIVGAWFYTPSQLRDLVKLKKRYQSVFHY
jgi:hypothetical protein